MEIDQNRLFIFRLAQEFGIINVREIEDLPASVLNGWREYFSIYPFSQDREDIRNALLRSTIYNVSGKSLKKDVDFTKLLPDYLKAIKNYGSPKKTRNEENLRYIKWMESMKDSPAIIFGNKPKKQKPRRRIINATK